MCRAMISSWGFHVVYKEQLVSCMCFHVLHNALFDHHHAVDADALYIKVVPSEPEGAPVWPELWNSNSYVYILYVYPVCTLPCRPWLFQLFTGGRQPPALQQPQQHQQQEGWWPHHHQQQQQTAAPCTSCWRVGTSPAWSLSSARCCPACR